MRFLIILLLVLNALAFAAISGWLGEAPGGGEPGRIAAQLDPERIRLARELAAGSGLSAPPVAPTPALPVPALAAPAPAEPEVVASADMADAPPDAPEGATGVDAGPAEADDARSPAPAPAQTSDADEAVRAESAEGPPPDAATPTEAEPASAENAAAPADTTGPPPVCLAWANLSADHADRISQRLRRIGVTPVRVRTEAPDSWWVRIPPQRSRAEAERRVVELNLLGVTDTFIVQESGPTQHAVSLGVFKTEARARVLLGQLREKGVSGAGIEPRMATTYRIQATLPANEVRAVESAAPGLRGKRQACTPR